jgi:hypothetical protein
VCGGTVAIMWFAPTLLLTAASGWSIGTILVWIGGLVCGVVLMVALTTDWERLPAYLRLIGRALRQQAGWAALAAGSLAVLVFY